VLTISLLLPEHKTLKYAKSLMKGVQTAADRWGMVIASGDTKKNASVAVVVTVIGKAKRSRRLPRSGAKVGDLLVVTGHLGTMFTATLAHQSRSEIPADLERIFQESLENQRPPVELGLAFSRSEIAHACTDISDGLPGAVFDLCNSSEVGTEIEIHKIPVIEKVWRFANTSLELKRESLISANGDWQFLYAIPQKKYEDAVAIAREIGVPISTIGTFTAEQSVTARGGDGLLRYLNRIENDGFFKVNGESYFDRLASNPPLLGSIV